MRHCKECSGAPRKEKEKFYGPMYLKTWGGREFSALSRWIMSVERVMTRRKSKFVRLCKIYIGATLQLMIDERERGGGIGVEKESIVCLASGLLNSMFSIVVSRCSTTFSFPTFFFSLGSFFYFLPSSSSLFRVPDHSSSSSFTFVPCHFIISHPHLLIPNNKYPYLACLAYPTPPLPLPLPTRKIYTQPD